MPGGGCRDRVKERHNRRRRRKGNIQIYSYHALSSSFILSYQAKEDIAHICISIDSPSLSLCVHGWWAGR